MGDLVELALVVKAYVEENGRTLSLSQGKMMRDSESAYEVYYNKQTA